MGVLLANTTNVLLFEQTGVLLELNLHLLNQKWEEGQIWLDFRANIRRSAPSLDCLSCLAIALLNPGSGYEIIPMKLSRLQALGWEIRIILIKL
jgi:hypothetical protein